MLQGIPLDRVLKFLEQVDGLLDALGLAEVVVDELLKLSVELRDGDVEGDVFFVEVAVSEVQEIVLSLGFELVPDAVELADDHVHFLEV